ncbi:TPA: hypothetical protein N0F65_009655 [Lagenidium giganteum]|uniref:Thiolase N-terminal domain-containing protein n=1 Tax=Lagenidium giganteum TaxID=4803 RepID=A0AAV2YC41_9STRA|nr:TPA: hypothetical protein N0F65_009655 [Lagenidium giganteum]
MDCTVPMGITSENVASQFGVTRAQQDTLAAASHAKAAEAQAKGWFDAEITPVPTIVKDKEGNEKEVTIAKDDGVRAGTTPEKLAKLRAAFKEGGTTTAGNSSQVSDGAAAVLLIHWDAPVLARRGLCSMSSSVATCVTAWCRCALALAWVLLPCMNMSCDKLTRWYHHFGSIFCASVEYIRWKHNASWTSSFFKIAWKLWHCL